ncbi:hypothetical protein M011DRAFT_226629 [Sporormia fimetaria CBS 119925]|uniref:Uncharacterized protein n=1 Tax=Sporormia fimetaria CBS 119925 TaxID=1340428 RepID=A0A6A6UY50_9PLEO|nr:hypothetical protein M011DRAFT_226629 [Sporormia fimetaria CBS 119925]
MLDRRWFLIGMFADYVSWRAQVETHVCGRNLRGSRLVRVTRPRVKRLVLGLGVLQLTAGRLGCSCYRAPAPAQVPFSSRLCSVNHNILLPPSIGPAVSQV